MSDTGTGDGNVVVNRAMSLEPISTTRSGSVTTLRFRVRK